MAESVLSLLFFNFRDLLLAMCIMLATVTFLTVSIEVADDDWMMPHLLFSALMVVAVPGFVMCECHVEV